MAAKNPPLDCNPNRLVNSRSTHYRGNKQSIYPRILGQMGKTPVPSDAFHGNYRLVFVPAPVHCQRTAKTEGPADGSVNRTDGDEMKIQNMLNRIASILALIIGLMAMFAGGKVLLGIMPDYYVIDWLPVYNFAMGLVSVFFCSIVIWRNSKFAIPAAVGTFGLHAVIMLILQTAYREVVAPDSIVAMTVRLIVWVVIVGLLMIQQRNKK
jgi:hypothetical protein